MSYSIYDLNTKIGNLQAAVGVVNNKISSLQVPTSPDILDVINQVFVHDTINPETTTVKYDTLQLSDGASNLSILTSSQLRIDDNLQSTTITPNNISLNAVGDDHETHLDNTQLHILDLATNDEMFIDHNSLILVQPTTTHQTELLGNMLDFQTPENLVSCGHTTYQDGHPGFEAYDLLTGDNSLLGLTHLTITSGSTGEFSSVGYDGVSIVDSSGTVTSTIHPGSIVVTSGVTSNTLDYQQWTGNIQTVNTVANATHYLNFSDSSGTGYGHPQKTTGINCNPSTNTVTATTFSGSLSGNSSSSSSISLTSDNTAGSYFVPFSKTVASNSTLYVDNTTTPLTYNPNTSTLTCSIVSATVTNATNASNVVVTSDNTSGSYYIPFSKLAAGTNPLYVDDFTSPLTYNPNSGLMSALYFLGDDILPTTQNTATFAGSTLSFSGASSGTAVSFRNASVVVTGGSNNLSTLTITNTLVNGTYKIGILNSGSGNLVVGTSLGTNIKTIYSGSFNISSGRYGWLTIDVVVINAVTTYVVNAFQLTN